MSTSNVVSRKATLTLPSQHGDSFGRKSTVANLGRRSTLGRRMSRRFTRKSIAIPTVFEPTYQLESFSTINFDHVNEIIRNCVIWSIPDNMPVYDCIKAAEFTQTLSKEIQARLKLQFYNRYRIVVVVNIFEKKWQQIQWKMMFLWDSENDQWTTFQHEANTFIVNVLVAFVYCDWWFDKKNAVSFTHPSKRLVFHQSSQHKTFHRTTQRKYSSSYAILCIRQRLKFNQKLFRLLILR